MFKKPRQNKGKHKGCHIGHEALEQGRPTELDILLLKHELEELTLMEKYGYGYEVAHLHANKKYPWEYKKRGGMTDDQIQMLVKKLIENYI